MSTDRRDLTLLTRAEQTLAEVCDIDTIKDILDKARAAKAYAKKAGLCRKIIVHAASIKVNTERRLGQLLADLPLANSAPGNQFTGKQLDRSQHATGPIRLQDLGITKSDSSRARQIAHATASVFNRYVNDRIEAGHEQITAGRLRVVKVQNANGTVSNEMELTARLATTFDDLVATGHGFAAIYANQILPTRKQHSSTGENANVS